MKVKAINKNTNQQFDCEEIEIKGYKYYISNEQPLNGEPYYVDNSLGKRIETAETKPSGIIKRIICSNNPDIDIPKVVDEVNRLAYEHCDSVIPKDVTRSLHYSFKCGYKNSQETHPFSEEDMIDFTEWLVKRLEPKYDCDTTMNFIPQVMIHGEEQVWIKGNEMITRFYTTKELLQLWKEQQPKIVYYE